MFWRVVHDTFKWVGISFFPGLFAIWMGALAWVESYPEYKPRLAQFYAELGAAMQTIGFWIIVGVALLAWLVGLIYSSHKVASLDKRSGFADLADLLREFRREIPVKIDPDSATHTVTSELTQNLAPELLTNSQEFFPPTVSSISNLYTGQVIVSASKLAAEENAIELAIRAFNGSNQTLRVVRVDGTIRGAVASGAGVDLPRPTWRPEVSAEPIPPGSEFMVVIDQRVSPDTAAEFLKAVEDTYVTLDLRNLDIIVEVDDEPQLRTKLPLWHAVTLRRRDDIFTGRMFIASISGSAAISFRASGTLKDADDEK